MKNVALALMAYEHAWKINDFPAPFVEIWGIRINLIYGLVAGILSLYLAQGFHLTRDKPAYFERLFILAIISQFPFSMLHVDVLNVVFTYLIGFIAIYSHYYGYYYLSFISLAISFIYDPLLDWGYIAVFMIFAFYLLLSYFPEKKITVDFFRFPKIFYYAFYPAHFFILIGIHYIT